MSEPRFERHGTTMMMMFDDDGVSVGISNMRENSVGVQAEVTVYVDQAGSMLRAHPPSRVNLLSDDGRSKLIKSLREKDPDIGWVNIIGYVCDRAITEFRRGEPVVDLADVELSGSGHYLVDKLLPLGETAMIYADGGSGKSYLSLALAIAVRTGISLPNGLVPTDQGAVLYLDWETQPETHARRLRRLSSGLGLQAVPHIRYRHMSRPISEEVSRIKEEVDEHKIKLTVVDSLAAASGDDPKEAGVALSAMTAIREIGGTRLVIHHVNAEAARGKSDAAPYGSRFFWNYTRSAWELRKVDDDSHNAMHLALYHRKANEERLIKQPLGFTLAFWDISSVVVGGQRFADLGGGGPITLDDYDVVDDDTLAARAPLTWRLREALRRGSASPASLASDLGANEDVIRKALARMPDVIELNQSGVHGRFGLRAAVPDSPRDAMDYF